MLYLHSFKQRNNFRNEFKVVLKQLTFEHCCKVFRNLLSFLETALQVISDFSNIGNVIVFWVLIVVLCELKLDLLRQEKLNGKIHDFLVLFRFKVIVIVHADTAAHH